jgi:hypothetical protein
MNTINGNFIERVIPNIKNATLNLLIGDQLATMNLADFQAAIAPSYTSSKGLKMKDNLPLDGTLNNVVDSSDVVTISPLQLSTEAVGISRTVNLSAGATNPRLFNEVYTINNSGAQTGTLTGIFLNATETALNGITHNLMDLQVGGGSRFLVNRLGQTSLSSLTATDFIRGRLVSPIGIQLLEDTAGGTFNRIQLGGTTNLFPAIKRNGAAIDFRLADDSNYCAVNTGSLSVNGNSITLVGSIGNTSAMRIDAAATTGLLRLTTNSVNIGGNTTNNASALLQADSTTQGFLMPRMTTAQINAIATPAEGLQVYNTTISHMCFYMSGAWTKVNHSPM